MKRTAEKALSIIGVVLTVIGVIYQFRSAGFIQYY